MDDDRYLTGGGEIIPEQRSASYSTNTSIGPFSGGAILAGQEDATPIVGGRFTTQLPEGLSATLSRTGQAGAPMEYARDAIRLAKQLEAGQLALEASRVGSQGLPSYGLQYSGQIGKQGGAPSYYPQPKGHWFVEAGGTPSTPERHVRGGARFNFADGGTVEDALHAVRQHFDEGGFLDAIRNYFTSDGDYQSTGDKVVSDGKVNWGDPELAADFFRADKARMALDKRPAVGRPEDDVTGSVPMPRPRPAPEAPAVKIPFEAPKAGFELPEQAKPEGAAVFPYTGFRAVPPGFAMPSPVAPDLPAPRAAPDVRPMAYAPAAGGAQAPALQAISAATSPLDIRDISHLAQYRGAAMENPQAVVFHHTAGEGTPEGVINTLNTRTDPFTGRPMVLGTHYIIDRDGGIHAALPSGTRGAHILPSKINDLSNANTYGVEVIAKDNSDVTPAQIAAGQRLYAHLSAGRSEPLGVFGHGELNPGHKLPDEGLAIVNPIRMAASPTSATDAAVDTARKVTNRAVNYPELSAEDKDLIAKTIAAEASGKSPEEAHAIANVILNRAISGGRFGKSIQDILFAKNQFEPWSDESRENYPMKFKPGMKAYDAAAEALQKAYDAGDITGGSTYFWAPRAQGRLGRDVPDFAKYPGFNIGATRFHRETREAGGEVDDALRVVREHHADGEAVGQAPVAADNSERVRAAEDAARLAKQIQAYEASMANIRQQPQDIQSMTHAPEKPRAPISIEALGKNREFGSAPYDVAAPLSSLAQGAYDLKTMPLYAAGTVFPPAAALGTALDTAEGVASGSPTQVAMGALGGPLKVARNVIAPLAVATGVTAPDEAEAAKLSKLIRAYHGSPYKFDRFDMSKIGTGEGAQSFGHGLYFAEHEPVAKKYRDTLSDTFVGDKPFNINDPMHKAASILHNDALGDKNKAISIIKNQLARDFDPFNVNVLRILEAKNDLPVPVSSGHMYEVNINAHPDQLLDWDKPLMAQSGDVRKALSKFDLVRANNEAHTNYNDALLRALTSDVNVELPPLPPRPRDYTGSQIHNALRENLHLTRQPPAPFLKSSADLSSEMNKHGIAGIKYLDAGSRGITGAPTHNYVIFNDKLIDINRRYAQGGDVDPASVEDRALMLVSRQA